MISHPVSPRSTSYRGKDKRKREKMRLEYTVFKEICAHINGIVEADPRDDAIIVFYSGVVALRINRDAELVRRLIFKLDGGHSGVTVFKGDYDKAMEKLGL